MTPDPLGLGMPSDKLRPNPFTYVSDRPMLRVDPAGLTDETPEPPKPSAQNASVIQPGPIQSNQPPNTLELQYPEFSFDLGGKRDTDSGQVSDTGTMSLQLHYRRTFGTESKDAGTAGELGLFISHGGFGPTNKWVASQQSAAAGSVLGTFHFGQVGESGVGAYTSLGFLSGQNPTDTSAQYRLGGAGTVVGHRQVNGVNPVWQLLGAGSFKLSDSLTLDPNFGVGYARFGRINLDDTTNAFSAIAGTDLAVEFKLFGRPASVSAETTATAVTDFSGHSSVKWEIGAGAQISEQNKWTLGVNAQTTTELKLQGGTTDTPRTWTILPTVSVFF
jgi:hypothetical protein